MSAEDLTVQQYTRFLQASLFAAGGTLLAARLALQFGLGINLGGGFHHAKPRYAEGFCLDDDARIFTYSVHQEEIYPSPKEAGSLDIALATGTGDADYLARLRDTLPQALAAAQPDLVFLLAGADTLDGDALASLAMTPQGLQERDVWVVQTCRQHAVPLAITLGGGYREDVWRIQADSLAGILLGLLKTELISNRAYGDAGIPPLKKTQSSEPVTSRSLQKGIRS